MTMKVMVRALGVCLLGGTFLFAAGCGYKNAPVPPQAVVPKPITDLLYTTSDKGTTLTWSYPVETIKGSAIEDISSFDLYRAEIALEDYCGGCPIPFGKAIEVDGGSPLDGKQRRKVTYEDSQMKSGHKYFFKVRSHTSWLAASGDSNIISFVWMKPAGVPEGVTAVAGDQQISVSWQPVSRYTDGSTLDNPVKYQLLKSVGGKDFEKIGEPIATTSFVDKQVKNGQKYFYAVQSVLLVEDEIVLGGRSKDVSSSPVDLTPPAPPSGVTAVSTSVGIKIFWDSVDDSGLGGYKVYRRAAKKDSYKLLGKVEPEFTLFVDRKSDAKVRYYYAVTAVDKSVPPNESAKSKEATIRY